MNKPHFCWAKHHYHLNILKTLLKDPCKAKTLLKEKKNSLIAKRWRSIIWQKISYTHNWNWILKEKVLEVFKGNNEKNTLFRKGLLPYQNRRQVGGRYYYTAKSSNQDKRKVFDFKTTGVQVPGSSIVHVQHQMVNTSFTVQKEVSVTSNSELVPLIKIATLEQGHPIIRKLFTKSIQNIPLAED